MNTTSRLFATLLVAPLLAGCFTTGQVPVPPTAPQREAVELRGVVVRESSGAEQRIEFEEVHSVEWNATSLSVVADVIQGGAPQTITQLYPISTLSGLLVRQLDAGATSAIIGGAIVGTAALIATVVTGTGNDSGS